MGYFLKIILVAMVTRALSMMCMFPHCDKVNCPPVIPEDCNGTVKLGGGYCGCCIACFTTLGEGEPCVYKNVMDQFHYPETALCGYGLYCDENTTICREYQWVG